jgi:hypothetical protein
MRIAHRNLTSLILSFSVIMMTAPIVASQESAAEAEFPRVEDWGLLRDDSRLKKRVMIDMELVTVGEIVAFLREKTGVPLTIDAAQPKERFPIAKGSLPAWKVMRQVVLTEGIEGCWEKSEDGYRLIPPPGKPGLSSLVWIFFVAFPVCLAAILLLRLRRAPRDKQQPESVPDNNEVLSARAGQKSRRP